MRTDRKRRVEHGIDDRNVLRRPLIQGEEETIGVFNDARRCIYAHVDQKRSGDGRGRLISTTKQQ